MTKLDIRVLQDSFSVSSASAASTAFIDNVPAAALPRLPAEQGGTKCFLFRTWILIEIFEKPRQGEPSKTLFCWVVYFEGKIAWVWQMPTSCRMNIINILRSCLPLAHLLS